MPAKPTFPPKEYHQRSALSLLCSEWEEVGHEELNHRQTRAFDGSLISEYSLHNDFARAERVYVFYMYVSSGMAGSSY